MLQISDTEMYSLHLDIPEISKMNIHCKKPLTIASHKSAGEVTILLTSVNPGATERARGAGSYESARATRGMEKGGCLE